MMRDIDFLTDRPAFAGTLIYRYHSGILRPQVRAALAEIAGWEGRALSRCERDDLLGTVGVSLVSDAYLCDWTALTPSSALASKLDAILTRIVAMAGQCFALFIPFESSLSARPLWDEVERTAGLVLVEDHVTSDTLLPALSLFQAMSDLATGADWLADPAFVASFDRFRARGRRTLLELRHAFDERVAACTDPVTHAFRPEVYRDLHPDEERSHTASARRDLRRLLARHRGWDRFALVRTLDDRLARDGWTALAVIAELHRATASILEQPNYSAEHGVMKSVGIIDLVLWAALLLSWDGRFRAVAATDADGYRRRPSCLVITLDELGRDFLARADLTVDVDPLAGVWAGLDDALMRIATSPTDALGSVRMATLDALHQRLCCATTDIAWMLRLRRRVRRAIGEAEAAETERRADEIGRERAVQDAAVETARAKAGAAAIARALDEPKTGR
ncbi:hypothetical protein [Methylobacterium sp. SyP6R]|uniref:hypothetical protein n=1 Tax=Methylobacterium sp. SyP6R TaxID=2718876 RepID=UPI001F3742CD|nr:hypothetical protein [Methylobacterium sp. SyP6R]MCF4124486.1 hypothetical protein [Methylobacterium sp. SyP6R]